MLENSSDRLLGGGESRTGLVSGWGHVVKGTKVVV